MWNNNTGLQNTKFVYHRDESRSVGLDSISQRLVFRHRVHGASLSAASPSNMDIDAGKNECKKMEGPKKSHC